MIPALKIMKFGGSSVGTASAIRQLGEIVHSDTSRRKVLVLSAQAGVTDMLLASQREPGLLDLVETRLQTLSEELLGEVHPELTQLLAQLRTIASSQELPPAAHQDLLASFGERLSVSLVAAFLANSGIPTRAIDSREMIRTDSTFGRATYDLATTQSLVTTELAPLLGENVVPVVTGFIGSDCKNRTTTLGRGGSDLTASLLGQCLLANQIEIWSDADGLMSADPRLVPTTRRLTAVSYAEAVELSNFGARILYNRTLVPAMEAGIPICLKNTFNPTSPGTTISQLGATDNLVVTHKTGVAALTISNPRMIAAVGYLSRLFACFEQHTLSVDVVTVSEASVSVTFDQIDETQEASLLATLSGLGEVTYKKNCGLLAVISPRWQQEDLFPVIFGELRQAGVPVEMVSFGHAKVNLTLVLPEAALLSAVRRIHDLLIQPEENTDVPHPPDRAWTGPRRVAGA